MKPTVKYSFDSEIEIADIPDEIQSISGEIIRFDDDGHSKIGSIEARKIVFCDLFFAMEDVYDFDQTLFDSYLYLFKNNHVKPSICKKLGITKDDVWMHLSVDFLTLNEDARGNKIGYDVLNNLMKNFSDVGTIITILPFPVKVDRNDEIAVKKGKKALYKYYEDYGFIDIGGGYMAIYDHG